MKNAPIAVAAAAVLFATAGIVKRVAPEGITAAHFGLSRLLVGGLVLAALAGPARIRQVLAGLPRVALFGAAASLALFQWAFFAGVEGAGVAVGTLVGAGASPVCAEAIEALRSRRRPSATSMLSALLTVAAIAILATAAHGRGIAMALTAALAFAIYASIARTLERAASGAGLVTTSVALVCAGILLLPAGAAGAKALATPSGLAVVLYLALVTTAIAYRLFVPALRHVSAAHALAILQLQPLASVVAGGILGEKVDAPILAGVALLGLALAVRFIPRVPSSKGVPHGST